MIALTSWMLFMIGGKIWLLQIAITSTITFLLTLILYSKTK